MFRTQSSSGLNIYNTYCDYTPSSTDSIDALRYAIDNPAAWTISTNSEIPIESVNDRVSTTTNSTAEYLSQLRGHRLSDLTLGTWSSADYDASEYLFDKDDPITRFVRQVKAAERHREEEHHAVPFDNDELLRILDMD